MFFSAGSTIRAIRSRDTELISGVGGIDLRVRKGEIRGLIGVGIVSD